MLYAMDLVSIFLKALCGLKNCWDAPEELLLASFFYAEQKTLKKKQRELRAAPFRLLRCPKHFCHTIGIQQFWFSVCIFYLLARSKKRHLWKSAMSTSDERDCRCGKIYWDSKTVNLMVSWWCCVRFRCLHCRKTIYGTWLVHKRRSH